MLQTRSYGSVKTISLDRDRLLARLGAIAAVIRARHPEVVDIRVFGSLARADHTGTSDVDVLILLDSAPDANPHRRILDFLRYFDLPIATDLIVLTQAEMQARLRSQDPFALGMEAESVAI